MNRTAVNPWPWSLNLGYNQAEMVEEAKKHLICAGQTSVDQQGNPQHQEDIRGQVGLAMENLEAVLKEAGMSLRNVVKLVVYATDTQEVLKSFDLLGQRFGPAGVKPPMTLLGINSLAIPGLMVEIEATAMA